jgi:hypothetical protein
MTSLFRHVRKIAKGDCQLRHVCLCLGLYVCPSVRMEQLGSYRMDFYEI